MGVTLGQAICERLIRLNTVFKDNTNIILFIA